MSTPISELERLRVENTALRVLLGKSRTYVDCAYEAQFPDEAYNETLLARIDSALQLHPCEFCGENAAMEVSYSGGGSRTPVIGGLLKDVCESCGSESISMRQLQHNHGLFDKAVTR